MERRGAATTQGSVDAVIAEEIPGLRLAYNRVEYRPGRTPAAIRDRLGDLATRYTGATVIAMRTQQIPRAYRTLYRLLGLDPDQTPTPVEAVAQHRLFYGGFRTRDLLPDVLVLTIAETGVPVWALDAGRVTEPLRITVGRVGGDSRGGQRATDQETLVIADQSGPVAALFEQPPPERAAGSRTTTAILYAVAAPGVSDMHVDEALWLAADALQSAE